MVKETHMAGYLIVMLIFGLGCFIVGTLYGQRAELKVIAQYHRLNTAEVFWKVMRNRLKRLL